MQILSGSKRDITVRLWKEQLEKEMKRVNDAAECFYRFSEIGDLDYIISMCKKISETAEDAKKAIEYMTTHDIK